MNAQINYLMGMALEHIQRGSLDDAERLLKQSLKMMPKNTEALRLMGVIFAFKQKFSDALEMFDASIKCDSKNWLAHSNRGNALMALGEPENAIKSYDRSIALNPNYAEAYNNKGNALKELRQYEIALNNYDKAISLNPRYAEAFGNIGNTLLRLNINELALEAFERGLSVGLDRDAHLDAILHCKMKLCRWGDIDNGFNELIDGMSERESAIHPFSVMPYVDDPFLIQAITRNFVAKLHPENHVLGPIQRSNGGSGKIHIGYFSSDFKNHAVSYLMANVIERHDRDQFIVSAFSTNMRPPDAMTERLRASFDQFYDVAKIGDKEIAHMARECGVDIAIDLGGLTVDSRPGIFAIRAAPVQIGYIGYLGTMAAPYMDYLVADENIIPSELQNAYSEKIIYLPSYQANDELRKVSDRVFSREELGLPQKGFVYCCFNNNYKITPSLFDSWAKILKQVDGSVLLLYAETEVIKENLRAEITSRGIESSRLIFAGRLEREDYLARYRAADLFLDTSPYNAGTTASDALWAGLPVLTFVGKSFSARMGASILNAIGLSELVAASQEEYEKLAIEIGRNQDLLIAVKAKLAANLHSTPLFNTQEFTKNLERAYIKVYERYQLGLPAEHIYQP